MAKNDTVAGGRTVPARPCIFGFDQRQRRGSASAGPLSLHGYISCRWDQPFRLLPRESRQQQSRQVPEIGCNAARSQAATLRLRAQLLPNGLVPSISAL